MTDNSDALTDAIADLVPPLLHGLDALGFIARHLHPPQLAQILEQIGRLDEPVLEALPAFQALAWPEHLHGFRDRVVTASECMAKAFQGLRGSLDDPNGMMAAYRALRYPPRALEALYPIAPALPPVNRFFLEPDFRQDETLLESLAAPRSDDVQVGVIHYGNDRKERGGFSVYVPENYDPARSYPLVLALHGGSGHGRSFLWSWLRTARSRGAILISPSSVDSTWSLMGPDRDGENLKRMVGHVEETWNVDTDHMLMTGMSDGGTFTYVQGLQDDCRFTHLAPMSASFHPMLMEVADPGRVQGLPVYLTHGAQDWMFPIDIARSANEALTAHGADLVYREVADLSHTYPSDENQRILDWFLDGKRPDAA